MLAPVPTADWITFINQYPQATIFHHPFWINLLAACYGYRPILLALQNGEGLMTAGLPLMQVNSWLTGQRAISLPFSDFCPPLGDDQDVLSILLNKLWIWKQQANVRFIQINWPIEMSEHQVYPGETFFRHITPLSSNPNEVTSKYKSKVRRFVQQAEKMGVISRKGDAWSDITQFYKLHILTRKRLGVPVQPLRFFRFIWEILIAKGMGFCILSYKDDQPIAGAIFLCFNRVLTYKFGASEPAYWHLRPNHQIFANAIRWGCENGYRMFDWGRTDFDDVGLRDFKLGWGSEEQVLRYSILADQPLPEQLSKGYLRRQMVSVIQHSPPWVCRMIGELLYGHFA